MMTAITDRSLAVTECQHAAAAITERITAIPGEHQPGQLPAHPALYSPPGLPHRLPGRGAAQTHPRLPAVRIKIKNFFLNENY